MTRDLSPKTDLQPKTEPSGNVSGFTGSCTISPAELLPGSTILKIQSADSSTNLSAWTSNITHQVKGFGNLRNATVDIQLLTTLLDSPSPILSTPAIVGIAIGGSVALTLIITCTLRILWTCCRRKKQR